MLCNYFCSHECEIGQAYVPEVQLKDVSQITLEMLANLNKMVKIKERLIEITVDGEINSEEVPDFRNILQTLDQMSMAIDSMKLWVQHQVAAGNDRRKRVRYISGTVYITTDQSADFVNIKTGVSIKADAGFGILSVGIRACSRECYLAY